MYDMIKITNNPMKYLKIPEEKTALELVGHPYFSVN